MSAAVACRWFALAPMGLVLAACAAAQPPSSSPAQEEALPASDAHSHRDYTHQVNDLYLLLNPICPRSSVANADEAYAPARAAFDAYRRSIEGSPDAARFDAGVAQARHWQSVVDINCQAPNHDSTETLRSQILDETRRALAALQHSRRD